jgi:CO dehydrogenase maturation factor
MKVLICGKGGIGKSTLAALIAIAMKNRGYCVLLIDADESNYGLHRMLGISHPVYMLDNLGGKKGFRQKHPKTRLTCNGKPSQDI